MMRRIGSIGGSRSGLKGFASDKVGPDGLTGKDRARIAGSLGGQRSRRSRGPKVACARRGCHDLRVAKGLCHKHYQWMRRWNEKAKED